jgi:hypothetical protein
LKSNNEDVFRKIRRTSEYIATGVSVVMRQCAADVHDCFLPANYSIIRKQHCASAGGRRLATSRGGAVGTGERNLVLTTAVCLCANPCLCLVENTLIVREFGSYGQHHAGWVEGHSLNSEGFGTK